MITVEMLVKGMVIVLSGIGILLFSLLLLFVVYSFFRIFFKFNLFIKKAENKNDQADKA